MVHMVAMIRYAYAYACAYDYVHSFDYYNPCARIKICLNAHLNPNAKSIDDSNAMTDKQHRDHRVRICLLELAQA